MVTLDIVAMPVTDQLFTFYREMTPLPSCYDVIKFAQNK